VAAGAPLLLPAAGWFGLDENAGLYHLYLLVATQRLPDLEQQLAGFAAATLSVPSAPRPIEAPVVVEQDWIEERGTTVAPGVTSQVIRTRDGDAYEVSPDRYGVDVEGVPFVLTRTSTSSDGRRLQHWPVPITDR
jgi:hypothetical protein